MKNIETPKTRKPKAAKLIIIDEASDNPPGIFQTWKGADKLEPREMWPDGKVRPHQITTPDGQKLRLTTEEYEQLVLAARHRARANPQPASLRPRPALTVGQDVHLEFTGAFAAWTRITPEIRKIKKDGRVIIAHAFCLPDLEGQLVRVAGEEYDVLRSSGGTATIRLRPAAV